MVQGYVQVCRKDDNKHFLRLFVRTRDGEILMFNTNEEFTKPEADYRAMGLSTNHGWKRDELPTHEGPEAYPNLNTIDL